MSHDHRHGSADADQRWLTGALALVVVFMVAELIAGLAAHSLALLADAGHMLTDAAALLLGVVTIRLVRRPARGAFTYGLARVDALSGQANGITLLLLAIWFAVEGVRRLIDPAPVQGGVVALVAAIGAVVNVIATVLASRADRSSLNVQGVIAHLLTDIWAFAAAFVAGLVVVTTGWLRADPVASLIVAALMTWTGLRLVRDSGRVFLEAAPSGVDPDQVGAELAAVDGVAEVHDLHVWTIGSTEPALSAHVLVHPRFDCHVVSAALRARLIDEHGIDHITLQVDHVGTKSHDADNCVTAHGERHVAT